MIILVLIEHEREKVVSFYVVLVQMVEKYTVISLSIY